MLGNIVSTLDDEDVSALAKVTPGVPGLAANQKLQGAIQSRGHSTLVRSQKPLDPSSQAFRAKKGANELEDIMNQMEFDQNKVSDVKLRQLT